MTTTIFCGAQMGSLRAPAMQGKPIPLDASLEKKAEPGTTHETKTDGVTPTTGIHRRRVR